MKKLKIKVFTTIFLILTISIVGIFIFSTTRVYYDKLNNLESILIKNKNNTTIKNFDIQNEESTRKIFMDFDIYTIILDDMGDYTTIINHTNNDNTELSNIETIAKKIINKHTANSYIGNLYFNKYSYSFSSNNTLIISDNTSINKYLKNNLITNIIILIVMESIVLLIAYYLTKWIITPVNEAFEKQKRFIADASHELKTPLAVITASTEAYFYDKNDKWVNNIKDESSRMAKLVKDLLNLASSEKELELVKTNINLSSLIEKSVLTFESVFFEHDIKYIYNIEPNIIFNCNEEQIKPLMSILIDNAIKHTEHKGEVIINLNKNNKDIILEVKNLGEPIKREDEKKIFERFYKCDDSRNRNSNNYGLGLAIAKNIVESHSGKISASSNNSYTTFKVIWSQK
jgi:signal transduction histidine kinase